MKVCLSANTSWYIFNFRATTIMALIKRGDEVIVVAPEDEYSDRLRSLGCRFVSIDIDAGGRGIAKDFATFRSFLSIFRTERPDVILTFTPKNNIYGVLAARVLGIASIANVAGVGSQFGSGLFFNRFITALYRSSLKKSLIVFFQNQSDCDTFLRKRIVSVDQARRVLGSGVDLERFIYSPRALVRPIRFLFVGRILRDKGILVFAEAAREIQRSSRVEIEFRVVGIIPRNHPNAVIQDEIDNWAKDGAIEFVGASDHVEDEIVACDCLVLPSFYGEGVPKVLLEAAACGRPAITTDMPGCCDAVEDGVTGFLCAPRSVESLKSAIQKFLLLEPEDRSRMGVGARYKAEKEFSDQSNIQTYLSAISEAIE